MSEGTNSGEDEKDIQQDIIEEGFVRLQPERNFYDQPPFNRILTETATVSGLPLEHLYLVLSRFSERTGQRASVKGKQKKLIPTMDDEVLGRLYTRIEESYDHMAVGRSLKKIVTDLARYPDWKTYVNSRIENRQYRKNGEYIQPPPSTSAASLDLPLSYLAWLQHIQALGRRLEGDAVIQVLGETFPQQAGPTDRSVVMRTWNIRRTRGLSGGSLGRR